MLLSADCMSAKGRKAFTLIEVLTSSFIVMYLFLAAWSMYMIGWRWWHEVAPIAECQRIARVGLSSVIEGTRAWQETISSVTYNGKSGIAWTTLTKADTTANPVFVTPVLSVADASAPGVYHRIDYKLEPDSVASNGRSFYVSTDITTNTKAIYGDGVKIDATQINATQGDVVLSFEKPDATYPNLIKVTVTVTKSVPGTRFENAPVTIIYSDFINLKNV